VTVSVRLGVGRDYSLFATYSLFADFPAVVAEPTFGGADEVRMKSVRARRVKLQ
jgi:hypothetical protein